MAVQVVVLAAGKGTRMQASKPKVLHSLGGKPLLSHVLETAVALNSSLPPVVVYGHQGELIKTELAHFKAQWIRQEEQLGTGHALQKALPHISRDAEQVLVLYGDVPLIAKHTLTQLITGTPRGSVGLLTAIIENPTGYGRIKRDEKGDIVAIVEHKDATDTELRVREINPGIYCLPVAGLKNWLPQLKKDNTQGEYYLTDIIKFAQRAGVAIHSFKPSQVEEILGVNDFMQLASLERFYQLNLAKQFMMQGTTFLDPHRFDCRGELEIGQDVIVDINVIFEGRVVIGNECVIGPHCVIKNTIMGDRVEVKAHSVIDGVVIANDCIVGPFARLRQGTVLSEKVHIGNFVEVKNSYIGEASKVNHLSYVGDSDMGRRVNMGAGTITCNYDGKNKHKTIIGDDTFIGSDTQLVAPVTIGSGATIGAGSTITKDVPPNQLTITHQLEQRIVENWQRPEKIFDSEK